jgi:hypothetical protein
MATDKLVCAGASENVVVVVVLCKNANMASIRMIIFTTSQNHKELYDKGFFRLLTPMCITTLLVLASA